MSAPPRPGDVLVVDGRASVQFADGRGFLFRVTHVSTQPTYHGWVWLTGYVLDRTGRATQRREIYVQLAGLRRVPPSPVPHQRARPGRAPGAGDTGTVRRSRAPRGGS